MLSITSQVQNSVIKRKKNRCYNQLLVDMMPSQTHREKTCSQGHFVIKGFSDLTVRANTTLKTGACMWLLANWSNIWPSDLMTATSHLCFFIQVIWCDISPSAFSWRIKLLLTSALRRVGIMAVHNWLKCKTYIILNDIEL